MKNCWFPALRKQARHLENDIDLKLVAFNKVGAGSTGSPTTQDTSPLLGEHVYDTLSVEIEQMLDKLSSINEKMAELPNTGAAIIHTIQRHREILHVRVYPWRLNYFINFVYFIISGLQTRIPKDPSQSYD